MRLWYKQGIQKGKKSLFWPPVKLCVQPSFWQWRIEADYKILYNAINAYVMWFYKVVDCPMCLHSMLCVILIVFTHFCNFETYLISSAVRNSFYSCLWYFYNSDIPESRVNNSPRHWSTVEKSPMLACRVSVVQWVVSFITVKNLNHKVAR